MTLNRIFPFPDQLLAFQMATPDGLCVIDAAFGLLYLASLDIEQKEALA